MKLAVLGGSFNPVHNGHLALAEAAHREAGFDRVLLVPARFPPHKQAPQEVCDAQRLHMLTLACPASSWLEVSSIELDREGVSYTIDTLRALRAQLHDLLTAKIAMIIGEDLVPGFSSWKEAAALACEFDILLACRPGFPDHSFPFPHRRLENEPIAVSSSAIRQAIREGRPWDSLVPPAVYRYIVEQRLYDER